MEMEFGKDLKKFQGDTAIRESENESERAIERE